MQSEIPSWVGSGSRLLDIRIEGLRDHASDDEDCMLGVCFVLGVPHHAQFLRVHEIPDPENADRTIQAGTCDPNGRYDEIQQIYPARDYQTVDLTELGFPGQFVVLIHPFEA